MTYTPPTLSQMRDKVELALRDSGNLTFSTGIVDDFIKASLAEVNRLYPLMEVETVDIIDTDEDGNVDRTYTVQSNEISRIEVWREGAFSRGMPQMDTEPNSGWDLWGSTLTIPAWFTLDEDLDSLKAYGYRDRDIPDADADTLEVDVEAEYAIRAFAIVQGYQMLQGDRSLFQQWLDAPGNNDISPTQLDSMANTYIAQWERQRNHLRRLRR